MKTISLFLGALLFFPSLFTIFLMAREHVLNEHVYSQRDITGVYFDLSPEWEGRQIRLSDKVSPDDHNLKVKLPWGYRYAWGKVEINIDGADWSWDNKVQIRADSEGILNRYHLWIYLGILKERGEPEQFVIVQRAENAEQTYRILKLHKDGAISEDVFSHSERLSPVDRMFFVRRVHPGGIGFRSNVLQVWPSIFYPILYPAVSAILGGLLLLLGGVAFLLRKKAKYSKSPISSANSAYGLRITKALSIVLISIAFAIVALFLGFRWADGVIWNRGLNERIIFPEDFRGYAVVVYGVDGAPYLKDEEGWMELEFPLSGAIYTASYPNYGWRRIGYYVRSGNNLVELKPTMTGPFQVDVSQEEVLVTGGGTQYSSANPTVRVFFVGNAHDRMQLDMQSSRNRIQEVVDKLPNAQQDGARSGE